MPEFKDMLKYYRERIGLTQREFALKINIAPATIGMYERGQRHPDFETEEKIADFFNVSLDNLRGRDSEYLSASDKRIATVMDNIKGFEPDKRERVLSTIEAIIDVEKKSEKR